MCHVCWTHHPFNSPERLANAKTWKENKENYQTVLGDLESHGYAASLITFETGALCLWLPITHSVLMEAFPCLHVYLPCVNAVEQFERMWWTASNRFSQRQHLGVALSFISLGWEGVWAGSQSWPARSPHSCFPLAPSLPNTFSGLRVGSVYHFMCPWNIFLHW